MHKAGKRPINYNQIYNTSTTYTTLYTLGRIVDPKISQSNFLYENKSMRLKKITYFKFSEVTNLRGCGAATQQLNVYACQQQNIFRRFFVKC